VIESGEFPRSAAVPSAGRKNSRWNIFEVELPDETVGEGLSKTEVSQMLNLHNPG